MNNWSGFHMNQPHLIYHSPITGKGKKTYINCVTLLLGLSIYTAQLKFSTDFNMMPHFEWTWNILFDVINIYGDLENLRVFLCPPDKR